MSVNSLRRKEELRELLSQENQLTVAKITQTFGVSEATARRDLSELEKEGYLVRTYGGAVKSESNISFEYFFTEKQKKNILEKKLIAQEAVEMIKEGETIFIDSGSTTWQMAKILRASPNKLNKITIISNSLAVAGELSRLENLSLILLGGIFRPKLADVCGRQAEDNLRQYFVDKAFLGVDGISAERGLTTTDFLSANLEKEVIKCSKQVIALADNTKVGRSSLLSYVDINRINILITDDKTDKTELNAIRDSGTKVLVVKVSAVEGEVSRLNLNNSAKGEL